MMPAPFGWVSEENPQAAAQSAAEAAAARVRRQGPSRPFGALSPSPLENTARAIGEIPGRMVDTARKFTEGAMNMPLGASVQDYPEVIDAGTETAMNLVGTPGGTGGLGSGVRTQLYHGSPRTNIAYVNPSARGPLGPGVYTTEAENVARRYAGADGRVYEMPEQTRDIYRGHGHRTDDEWRGFKEDQARLLAAAEPEKREALAAILDKMWSGDGYPTYQRVRALYGNDEAAQQLYRKAGFEGISGQVDGPETLLFGPRSQPIKNEFEFLSRVKPARENLDDVLASNFLHGRKVGSRSMPIDKITTSMSSAADDAARAKALGERMKAEGGYWERPIVDAEGNVVEGQHRISALRGLGYTGDVPVTVVRDAAAGLPIEKMREAIRAAEKTHPDQVHQIIGQVVDMIDDVGSAKNVLQEYEFPAAYRGRFEAALKAAQESK